MVKLFYDDNTETVVVVSNFDNLDIEARKGQDQKEFKKDKEVRDKKKEVLSDIETLEREQDKLRNSLD